MLSARVAPALVVAAGLVCALSACQNATTSALPPSATAAVPTAAPSATVFAPPTTSSASSSASSAASSAAVSSAATAASARALSPATSARATASPAAHTLGPDGLGSVKLGMSRTAARATGMVAAWQSYPESDKCLWRSSVRAAPAGGGVVFFSDTFGVATIDAYPGVRTPEGIGIGSSLTAVSKAYPDWHGNGAVGHGHVQVPGHSALVYRIGFSAGKVTELTLQYDRQDCYE